MNKVVSHFVFTERLCALFSRIHLIYSCHFQFELFSYENCKKKRWTPVNSGHNFILTSFTNLVSIWWWQWNQVLLDWFKKLWPEYNVETNWIVVKQIHQIVNKLKALIEIMRLICFQQWFYSQCIRFCMPQNHKSNYTRALVCPNSEQWTINSNRTIFCIAKSMCISHISCHIS